MENKNHVEIIWGIPLLDQGFTSIPNILIRNYRKLDIQHGEWGFISVLLTYKHDTRDPYPSRVALAEHLCVSEKQIDKWVKSLKEKGLLITGRRRNKTTKRWDNTVYNFKPLIDAALILVGEKPTPESDSYDIEWDIEPRVPEVLMEQEPEVSMGMLPEVGHKKKRKKKNKKDDDELINSGKNSFQEAFETEAKKKHMPGEQITEISKEIKVKNITFDIMVLKKTIDLIMENYPKITSLPAYFLKAIQENQKRYDYIKQIQSSSQSETAAAAIDFEFEFYNWLEE